jgi:hypothetical protein
MIAPRRGAVPRLLLLFFPLGRGVPSVQKRRRQSRRKTGGDRWFVSAVKRTRVRLQKQFLGFVVSLGAEAPRSTNAFLKKIFFLCEVSAVTIDARLVLGWF